MPRIIQWKKRRTRSFQTVPQIYGISITRARVGASVSVTLTGNGFRNCPLGTPPQILIGGLPATNVVVVDSNTITFTSPVATTPGVVDIVLTVDCCE